MSYRGVLTGRDFESEQARDHYEQIEAMKRRVPTEEEKLFDSASPDKIRQLFNRALQSEEDKAAITLSEQNGITWANTKPQYIDDEANARQIKHWLDSRGIKLAKVSDFEDAFTELSAAGLLKVNDKFLAEQKAHEHRLRAHRIVSRGGVRPPLPPEDELRNLSLDELRRRAVAELQEPDF